MFDTARTTRIDGVFDTTRSANRLLVASTTHLLVTIDILTRQAQHVHMQNRVDGLHDGNLHSIGYFLYLASAQCKNQSVMTSSPILGQETHAHDIVPMSIGIRIPNVVLPCF